jgi:hypothetical protein
METFGAAAAPARMSGARAETIVTGLRNQLVAHTMDGEKMHGVPA